MKSCKLWMLVAVILAGSASLFAQTNVNEEKGMKPYDSFHGGDLDSVSMTNGGMVLHIPLASYPQRGNLDLSFSVFANTNSRSLEVSQWKVPMVCAKREALPARMTATNIHSLRDFISLFLSPGKEIQFTT